MAAQYYSERANCGQLMVTEATVVSEHGHGVPNAPGIYTAAQKEAWKPIVQAVKAKEAFFFCQLWYCGRVSHSVYNPGNLLPLSASDVPISDGSTALCPLTFQPLPFEPPKPMEASDITNLVESFRKAARAAIECGFDGIEIHGANGYVIDQFLKSSCNKRTDEYGGSVENRCRLCLQVLDAIVEEIGTERVGIRLSPYGTFNDATDKDPHSLFTYLCAQIRNRGIAYVHMIESRVNGAVDLDPSSAQVARETLTEFRKAAAPLPFIAAGGYTRDNSVAAIKSGHTDLVSIGRWALANPDLLTRWKLNAPLNKYDRSTFYTPFPEGYIDYPFLLDTPAGKQYHSVLAAPPSQPTSPATPEAVRNKGSIASEESEATNDEEEAEEYLTFAGNFEALKSSPDGHTPHSTYTSVPAATDSSSDACDTSMSTSMAPSGGGSHVAAPSSSCVSRPTHLRRSNSAEDDAENHPGK